MGKPCYESSLLVVTLQTTDFISVETRIQLSLDCLARSLKTTQAVGDNC